MSGIYPTKISARADDRDTEGLARLLAYGERYPELDSFQIGMSTISSEPAFEHLADTGFIVVRGIKTARVALYFNFEQSSIPEIHSVDISVTGELSIDTGTEQLYDPNALIRINAGTSGKKAAYYVVSATCSLKGIRADKS